MIVLNNMSLLKASFFEKLVQLLRVHFHVEIHDLIHINQIHYHNNPNAPVFQQPEPQKISLNLSKMLTELPPNERDELQQLIAAVVVQDGIPSLRKVQRKGSKILR